MTVISSNGESKNVSAEFGLTTALCKTPSAPLPIKWKLLSLMELTRIGTPRALEREGLVSRQAFVGVPPGVEYMIAENAETLMPILHQLHDWALRRLRRT